MTDRQFVRKHYPNASLDFHVRPHNTLRATTFYTISTDVFTNKRERICTGQTREQAWRHAKITIKKSLKSNQQ